MVTTLPSSFIMVVEDQPGAARRSQHQDQRKLTTSGPGVEGLRAVPTVLAAVLQRLIYCMVDGERGQDGTELSSEEFQRSIPAARGLLQSRLAHGLAVRLQGA